MAAIIPTSLTSYELTEEEQRLGANFTSHNKMVIQNLIAEYSEAKVNSSFSGESVAEFAKQDGHNSGAIEALKRLLALQELYNVEL